MTKAEAMLERPAAINADIEELRDREIDERVMDEDVPSKHGPSSARDEPIASSGNALQYRYNSSMSHLEEKPPSQLVIS